MKELKALEILKRLRDEYIHGELSSDINEAIAELEALQLTVYTLEAHIAEFQAPKKCSECASATKLNMAYCNCSYFGKVKVNHFCSYYEPEGGK